MINLRPRNKRNFYRDDNFKKKSTQSSIVFAMGFEITWAVSMYSALHLAPLSVFMFLSCFFKIFRKPENWKTQWSWSFFEAPATGLMTTCNGLRIVCKDRYSLGSGGGTSGSATAFC